MLNIKEIALRIGEKADEYADAKLQSKGEFHPDWHTVRDEYFAEALIAEIAKQNEPVAWMCSDVALIQAGYSKFSNRCEGAWSIPVFTFPPTVEQIDNETAWQSIETAPKDGTEILLYSETYGVDVAQFHKGKWRTTAGQCDIEYPTHWLLLPDAPKGEEK